MTRVVAAFLLLAIAGSAGLPAARADDESRLDRLERLLEQQASQIEALRRELEAARRPSRPGPQAPPPQAAPPGTRPVAPGLAQPGPDTIPVPTPVPVPPQAQAPVGMPSPQNIGRPMRNLGGAAQLSQSGLGTMRWGGYVQLTYRGSTQKNSYFDLHRLVLMFDTQITQCVDASMEFEIEHGGIGGGDRDGDVKLEHFTVNWRLADEFNIKVGAPLVPFGRYNLFHDDPLNDFTLRPWVARYMVPTGYGQPGIGLFGSTQAGCGTLSYDMLIGNGFDDGFTDSGGVRDARHSWKSDNNENKQVWGRLSYIEARRFFDYFEAGVSGTWGRYDDAGDNNLFGFAADVLIRKGPLELQAEYHGYDIERDAADPATAVRGQSAWFAQLAYHFFPCPWRRCTSCLVQDTSHFTLAARYQGMNLDDRVRGASFNDDLRGFTLGLNYRLNERTVFRLDHQWLEPEKASSEREWSFSFSSYF